MPTGEIPCVWIPLATSGAVAQQDAAVAHQESRDDFSGLRCPVCHLMTLSEHARHACRASGRARVRRTLFTTRRCGCGISPVSSSPPLSISSSPKGCSTWSTMAGVNRSTRMRYEAATGREGGGGGNRTRVRGRTGQNLYKRSPPLNLARRPEADALPAGQPSLSVALWAIGSPSAPSPLVGAATRITGPIRSDVAT